MKTVTYVTAPIREGAVHDYPVPIKSQAKHILARGSSIKIANIPKPRSEQTIVKSLVQLVVVTENVQPLKARRIDFFKATLEIIQSVKRGKVPLGRLAKIISISDVQAKHIVSDLDFRVFLPQRHEQL